jgi:hypothetical protein
MTNKKRIAELLNKWFKADPVYDKNKPWYAKESNLDHYFVHVTVDNEAYDVYMGGNDEMFDGNEFYQMGVTKDGKVYRFYFDTVDENGNDIELDCIDYTKAYRAEDVTKYVC